MSELGFLTVDATEASVVARSAMERLALAAGARFEVQGGWNVAVRYPGEERRRCSDTVAFADRSHLTKLEVHGSKAATARIAAEVKAHGASWWPVTPARALVLSQTPLELEATESGVSIVDVTCALVAMSLIGPLCRELLARFCAIDVRDPFTPVGALRPGSVARTPGYVVREREDQLMVLVGWAYGEYLWEVVADAAEHLGGGPVGADALTAHLEPAHA